MATSFGIRRQVIAGLSVMHQTTYQSTVELSGVEENLTEAATLATVIAMDASQRVAGRDLQFLTQAKLGNHYQRDCMSSYAMDAIQRTHRDSHLTDGAELRRTFEALGGFQRLCVGLGVLNRYFAPSAFTRDGNLFESVELHLRDIDGAVHGISGRRPTVPSTAPKRENSSQLCPPGSAAPSMPSSGRWRPTGPIRWQKERTPWRHR
ncbi:hypothetical protein HFN89_01920 [Rhizobium laguerreae]|nr:hypothetical protein [Rhizobium laguerreae]